MKRRSRFRRAGGRMVILAAILTTPAALFGAGFVGDTVWAEHQEDQDGDPGNGMTMRRHGTVVDISIGDISDISRIAWRFSDDPRECGPYGKTRYGYYFYRERDSWSKYYNIWRNTGSLQSWYRVHTENYNIIKSYDGDKFFCVEINRRDAQTGHLKQTQYGILPLDDSLTPKPEITSLTAVRSETGFDVAVQADIAVAAWDYYVIHPVVVERLAGSGTFAGLERGSAESSSKPIACDWLQGVRQSEIAAASAGWQSDSNSAAASIGNSDGQYDGHFLCVKAANDQIGYRGLFLPGTVRDIAEVAITFDPRWSTADQNAPANLSVEASLNGGKAVSWRWALADPDGLGPPPEDADLGAVCQEVFKNRNGPAIIRLGQYTETSSQSLTVDQGLSDYAGKIFCMVAWHANEKATYGGIPLPAETQGGEPDVGVEDPQSPPDPQLPQLPGGRLEISDPGNQPPVEQNLQPETSPPPEVQPQAAPPETSPPPEVQPQAAPPETSPPPEIQPQAAPPEDSEQIGLAGNDTPRQTKTVRVAAAAFRPNPVAKQTAVIAGEAQTYGIPPAVIVFLVAVILSILSASSLVALRILRSY